MTDTTSAEQAIVPGGASQSPAKPSAQRSSPYPSFTIQQSLEMTRTIYETYGSNFYVTREQVADLLKISSATVQSRMSTAVQYGLLELKPKTGYKVSDLFIKWMRPISDEQQKDALITAFRNPSLYEALIGKFDENVLPPAKPLANILLQNHRIYDAACDEAARIFIENATYLGVLHADRHLRLGSPMAVQEVTSDDPADERTAPVSQVPAAAQESSNSRDRTGDGSRQTFTTHPVSAPEGVPITVALHSKRQATVYLPADATAKDCETVVKWMNLLKETMD